MTSRLYYTDSYLVAFDTRVVDRGDDGRRVYLDRTAFYPTSGGQPFDTGTLGGAAVVDVIDEGERIAHLLDRPLAGDGDALRGEVDWARRFDHMQQHTGQHLLSAVFHDLFGAPTASVHFGVDSASLDIDTPSVTREQLVAAEHRANEIVFENRPVTVTFEDARTAVGLRKPSDREGEIRIVSIHGVDRSACGGTHVRATGEIGAILVRRTEKVKKLVRVEFLCGMRAIRRARADYEALSRVASSLSASIDEVAALVQAQGAQLKDAESRRKRLETELAAYRARELWDAAAPSAAGVRRVVERRESGSLDDIRAVAHAFAALPKSLFVGAIAEPPTVLVAASEDSGIDAGASLKAALAAAAGRGGGSARVAQGTVPRAELLDQVVEAMR